MPKFNVQQTIFLELIKIDEGLAKQSALIALTAGQKLVKEIFSMDIEYAIAVVEIARDYVKESGESNEMGRASMEFVLFALRVLQEAKDKMSVHADQQMDKVSTNLARSALAEAKTPT